MKKLLIVLVTVLIGLALFSCSDPCVTFCVEPFEATVEAESGETVMTGKLKYVSPSAVSLTVTQPEEICGLTFAFQDGNHYISVGSMTSERIACDILPAENNAAGNLFTVMQTLQSGITAPKGGTVKISRDSGIGKCLIAFNTDTGQIESVDAGKFKYRFTY